MIEKNLVYNSLSGGHMNNVVIEVYKFNLIFLFFFKKEIYLKEAKINEIKFYENLDNKSNEFFSEN